MASWSISTPSGRPDFQAAPRALSNRRPLRARLAPELPATPMLFDVLDLDGQATLALPYARPSHLPRAEPGSIRFVLRVPPKSSASSTALAVRRDHDLEGIVAKHLYAPHTPTHRTGAWLKYKHRGARATVPDALGTKRKNSALLDAEVVMEASTPGRSRAVVSRRVDGAGP